MRSLNRLLGIAAVLCLAAGTAYADLTSTQHITTVYELAASVATATGTTEQTLGTYSLPASTLVVSGQRVRACAAVHLATNGNNKTVKVYIGSTSVSSGTLTDSNKNAIYCLMAVRTGSKTQNMFGIGQHDTTMLTPSYTAATEDDTAAMVIKVTATDGSSSAGDIEVEDFWVELTR